MYNIGCIYIYMNLERERGREGDNMSLVIKYRLISIFLKLIIYIYICLHFQPLCSLPFLPSPPRVFFPYSHCFNRRRFGFAGSGASETVETVRSKDWRSSTRVEGVFLSCRKMMEANKSNKGPNENLGKKKGILRKVIENICFTYLRQKTFKGPKKSRQKENEEIEKNIWIS